MPRNPNTRKARPVAKRSRMLEFYTILGFIAVVGLSALGYISSRPAPVAEVAPDAGSADTSLVFGYARGDSTAPVTILEFADFECPACGNYTTLTEPDVRTRLIDTHRVRVVYYDFPLAQHANSSQASLAAACASDQGRFWQMHDKLFAGQLEWNTEATKSPGSVFSGYASSLGLDTKAWQTCFDSGKYKSRIQANHALGVLRGVSSTPTFIIKGRLYARALPYDELKAIVDSLSPAH